VPQAAHLLFPRWWFQDRVRLLQRYFIWKMLIQPSITTNNPKPVGRSSHLQEVPFKFRDIIQEFQLTVFVCTVRLYFRRARMKWTPPPAGCKILQLVVELDTVRREEDTYQTM
jgi:hypothetical protein